jgi:hypothetical protein
MTVKNESFLKDYFMIVLIVKRMLQTIKTIKNNIKILQNTKNYFIIYFIAFSIGFLVVTSGII